MTLLLSNADVESVLTMPDCIAALELTFRAQGSGGAVNRPRSHTYTELGPSRQYLFKSMDGAVRDLGVHALRFSSDLVHEVTDRSGRRTRSKQPAAPGDRYVGLVLLFDLETLVPLAIMPDGYLQRMRVGATSALAARHLARGDATTAGLVGAGWQAGGQLLGLHAVIGLERCLVFSPDPGRRHAFCAEYGDLGFEVLPAASVEEVVAESDVLAMATNALEPVLRGEWLRPGQHVGSVQGYELDGACFERADLIVVRSKEPSTYHYAPGRAPWEAEHEPELPASVLTKMVELAAVVGGASGRQDDGEVTLFTGSHSGASAGLGIQFAAVGQAVYASARAQGVGIELPTDWFTQQERP